MVTSTYVCNLLLTRTLGHRTKKGFLAVLSQNTGRFLEVKRTEMSKNVARKQAHVNNS